MQSYETQYYEQLQEGARRSAQVIVPLLLKWIEPQSVIDVGCGTGTWLAVFRELGVEDVRGVDGPYVETGQLEIPAERFHSHDLEKPFALDKTFDLVVSLEVAEHLSEEVADVFVDTLVGLGPVILFSAAVPFQGGKHHVNEQWPAYWGRRFKERGYRAIDGVRGRIWENDAVEWWYAQNIILYVRKDHLNEYPFLEEVAQSSPSLPRALVHPTNYTRHRVWEERIRQAFEDLTASTPLESTIVLVDEGKLVGGGPFGRAIVPFPERKGRYNGLPPDDETAIRELKRLRKKGADFLAVAWPAFWWLDHYEEFEQFVQSNFRCIADNDRLIVFDLRTS